MLDWINSIQDITILEEINRLLDVDFEDTLYQTTPEQKQEIAKARHPLDQNEGISSDEANGEIDEWLSK